MRYLDSLQDDISSWNREAIRWLHRIADCPDSVVKWINQNPHKSGVIFNIILDLLASRTDISNSPLAEALCNKCIFIDDDVRLFRTSPAWHVKVLRSMISVWPDNSSLLEFYIKVIDNNILSFQGKKDIDLFVDVLKSILSKEVQFPNYTNYSHVILLYRKVALLVAEFEGEDILEQLAEAETTNALSLVAISGILEHKHRGYVNNIFLRILERVSSIEDATVQYKTFVAAVQDLSQDLVVLDKNHDELTTEIIKKIITLFADIYNKTQLDHKNYDLIKATKDILSSARNNKKVIQDIVSFCSDKELPDYILCFVAHFITSFLFSNFVKIRALLDEELVSFLKQSFAGRLIICVLFERFQSSELAILVPLREIIDTAISFINNDIDIMITKIIENIIDTCSLFMSAWELDEVIDRIARQLASRQDQSKHSLMLWYTNFLYQYLQGRRSDIEATSTMQRLLHIYNENEEVFCIDNDSNLIVMKDELQ